MKPEAQRIAIAEACGWQMIQRPLTDQDGEIPGHVEVRWFHPKIHTSAYPLYALPQNPPDYLNDLNAIHEAEKTLTRVQRVKFVTELCGLAGVKWKPTSHFDTIHATAAQRAEAFLRTIGKWEDDK